MITSYEELPPFSELFEPDFARGELYWKVDRPAAKKGQLVGSVKKTSEYKQYRRTAIATPSGKRAYPTAKILYFLRYGIWCQIIDHINGDSTDDRIINLRECSIAKNGWNKNYFQGKKHKPIGAYFHTSSQSYMSRASIYGRCTYIGDYSTLEEAIQATDSIYHQYYGEDLTVDYYLDVEQGSERWKFLRQHRVTGTSAYKLLEGMSIEDTIKETERIPTFNGNQYTERGKILESENRKLYEDINQVTVQEVGGIINSKYPQFFYSPDGCVGLDGLIECKSFLEEHHEDTLQNLDSHIIAQIQFGLFVSERKWCDLCLYNPEVSDIKKAYWTKRFYPDEEIFQKFRDALSSPVDDSHITETGLTLIKLEQELQAQDEALKAQLQVRETLNQQIATLKQQLKDSTMGKISKTIQLGQDELSVSIYDTIKVDVEDASKVAEEYTLEVPLENILQHEDGTFYQRVPNPKLVQNLVKSGKSLPEGFIQKNTRTIRLKLNGKAI